MVSISAALPHNKTPFEDALTLASREGAEPGACERHLRFALSLFLCHLLHEAALVVPEGGDGVVVLAVVP